MPNDIEKIKEQLNVIDDEQKRADCLYLFNLMSELTEETPKLWRGNMIGFGTYAYKYKSGRQGEWFITGFCPRKKNIVVYIVAGFKKYDNILSQLGLYTTGSSCLYFKRLSDINLDALSQLITESVAHMKAKHGII